MNGSMLIGGIAALTIIGGTIVHGYQDITVASSNAAVLSDTMSSEIIHEDTIDASPTAATGIANKMSSSTATLHGVVYPHGEETSYWFEYTADPKMGLILIRKTPRITLITDMKEKAVEVRVTDLMRSTKYYFRIVTQDSKGTVRAEPVSFNTI